MKENTAADPRAGAGRRRRVPAERKARRIAEDRDAPPHQRHPDPEQAPRHAALQARAHQARRSAPGKRKPATTWPRRRRRTARTRQGAEEAKPRQEAVVKGITPAQPAPMVERPPKAEPAPVTAAPAPPAPAPAAAPASGGGLFERFLGWLRGPAPQASAPAAPAAPAVPTVEPRAESRTASQSDARSGGRGDRGGRGREGREGRPDRGPRGDGQQRGDEKIGQRSGQRNGRPAEPGRKKSDDVVIEAGAADALENCPGSRTAPGATRPIERTPRRAR